MWVAHNGTYQQVRKLWVANNGTYQQVRKLWVANNGTYGADRGLGGSITAFTAVPNPYLPYTSWKLDWASDQPLSNVVVTANGSVVGSAVGPASSGTMYWNQSGYQPNPATWYTFEIYAAGTKFDALRISGARLPMPPAPVGLTMQQFNASAARINWSLANLGGVDFQVVIPQLGISKMVTYPPFDVAVTPNQALDVHVAVAVPSGPNAWTVGPFASLRQTTASSYTPGVYDVACAARKTWSTKKGDWRYGYSVLQMGDPGDWDPAHNDQYVNCFYWPSAGAVDPFLAAKFALLGGGRLVKCWIQLSRNQVGNKNPIAVSVNGHYDKVRNGSNAPGNNSYVGWCAGGIDPGKNEWLELPLSVGQMLLWSTINGVQLGRLNTRPKDQYAELWDNANTGNLRFQIA